MRARQECRHSEIIDDVDARAHLCALQSALTSLNGDPSHGLSHRLEHQQRGAWQASREPLAGACIRVHDRVRWDRSPLTHPRPEGWGGVLLAHGDVVVSDVRLESAQKLRAFLDETVREANRLAVDTRAREQQQEKAEEVRVSEQEAKESAAAQAAAERDAQLTDAFQRSR